MNRRFALVLTFVCAAGFALAQAKPADKPAGKPADAPAAKPAAAGPVTTPTFHNMKCALMKGKAVKDIVVDTPNGPVYLCCDKCLANANKNPEDAYKKTYGEAKKLTSKKDPITGKDLGADAVKVTWVGYEFSCAKDSVEACKKNYDIVLTKLTNPKAKDVDNKTCPVTGGDIAPNTFIMIGDEIVHLGSKDAVMEAKKDPAKILAKAHELVAKPKAD